MRPSQLLLGLLQLPFAAVVADYSSLGPYPAPIDLSSNQSAVAVAWRNFSATFDNYLRGKNDTDAKILAGIENITFSVGMLSVHDPGAIKLQYHHTSPEIARSPNGTHKVDADSIYRIASVSKLITTFVGMLALSEQDWNRPLTEVQPAFASVLQGFNASSPVWNIQWDQVTLWSLATQTSGLPTGGLPALDLYTLAGPAAAKKFGAPVINASSWSPCAAQALQNPPIYDCSASDSVAALKDIPPNFLPFTTPAYSDLNFMLLGMAISNITGKSFAAMYKDAVFAPLGMDSSNDSHPTGAAEVARSIIPGNPALGFAIEGGLTVPSGGLLSTISDLQKLGIGILNHTLLSAETTRRWMKPASHTASLSYSVGGPWEIHRYVHPGTGKVTDLYTKLGDSGFYGGVLVLIPEYDAGFTMLNAWSGSGAVRSRLALVLLDYVTSYILPALEVQALAEARQNFVGTYRSSDASINASVTIAFNKSTPESVHSDLVVRSWSYNGTDVLAGPFFGGVQPRLELSVPKQSPAGAPGQVAFQTSVNAQTASYMAAESLPDLGVIGVWTGFYYSNFDFATTDPVGTRWGGISPDMFVFDVDAEGRATACTPAVDRIKLQRVKE